MGRRAFVLIALGSSVCGSATSAETAVDQQRTQLDLPFHGSWIVGQGYHGAETHSGRAAFALDLVKVDEDGRAYVRRGQRAKDWVGFGAEVLASADGVVVRAMDRFSDNRVMGKSKEVNTIIIRHRDGEFSEYVHLQRGSVRVRVGERVGRGQIIARCGNSGSQTPHLHWALLSSIDPIRTRPAEFWAFEVRDAQGAWQRTKGTPRSGELIRQQSAPVVSSTREQ
jgi:murein DD-endopeptidase MepM/ murein hydrolase activator NlpD